MKTAQIDFEQFVYTCRIFIPVLLENSNKTILYSFITVKEKSTVFRILNTISEMLFINKMHEYIYEYVDYMIRTGGRVKYQTK